MQITIEELTALIATKSQTSPIGAAPFEVGKNYFIRTVTYHHTGRLVAVHPGELVLEDAAWIADDGRFADALKSCEFNEVEPFPAGKRVIIGRASIIDAIEIASIPTSQK